jgi:hypothetical protein
VEVIVVIMVMVVILRAIIIMAMVFRMVAAVPREQSRARTVTYVQRQPGIKVVPLMEHPF